MSHSDETTRNVIIKNKEEDSLKNNNNNQDFSFINFLKNKKDECGSSYRDKFKEMKILYFILNKIKLKLLSSKYKRVSKTIQKAFRREKRKELRYISNIISIMYSNKLSIDEKLERIQKIPSISNLISDIKKEASIQLKEFEKKNNYLKQQANEGLNNGILGIKFELISKIIGSSIIVDLPNQTKKRNDTLCKKGSQKIKEINARKRRSRKSTKILKENAFNIIKTEYKSIGYFELQELKRRENIKNNYRNIN